MAPVDCEMFASRSTSPDEPWLEVRRIDHLPDTLAGEPPPPPPKMSPALGKHAERDTAAAIATTANTARIFRMKSVSFRIQRDFFWHAASVAGTTVILFRYQQPQPQSGSGAMLLSIPSRHPTTTGSRSQRRRFGANIASAHRPSARTSQARFSPRLAPPPMRLEDFLSVRFVVTAMGFNGGGIAQFSCELCR